MTINNHLTLTQPEIYMLCSALETYGRKVNKYYRLKLTTLARKISETGLALQPRTLRRALKAHSTKVSDHYAAKLKTLDRKIQAK